MPVTQHTITGVEGGQRIDRWFRHRYPGLGHGRLEKLLRTGRIRVDGKRVKAAHRLSAGETICIPPMGSTVASPGPKTTAQSVRQRDAQADRDSIEAMTIYRDKAVLVLNKPPGLPVQGGLGQKDSLDVMLRNWTRSEDLPRLVHRLDKDTSGVMVVGLNRKTAGALAKAFRSRSVRKLYWAAVVGMPARRRGFINLPLIKRSGAGGERMVIAEDIETDNAQRARTQYAVIDHAARHVTWLALMPMTGRKHQLRVHVSAIGTPILGDGKYGGSEAFVTGFSNKVHLHSKNLVAPHPNGGWIDAEAPLPPHMAETFDILGFGPRDDGDPFESGIGS